jgi:hypothetical protein
MCLAKMDQGWDGGYVTADRPSLAKRHHGIIGGATYLHQAFDGFAFEHSELVSRGQNSKAVSLRLRRKTRSAAIATRMD